MSLEEANSSLKQQLNELQARLDDMTNSQAVEREAMNKTLAEKSQQIIDLSYQLSAKNAELQKEVKEKKEIKTQFEKCKGTISDFCGEILNVSRSL